MGNSISTTNIQHTFLLHYFNSKYKFNINLYYLYSNTSISLPLPFDSQLRKCFKIVETEIKAEAVHCKKPRADKMPNPLFFS